MSTATCPRCGRPIRPGAKFCGACGAAIAAAPAQPTAAPASPGQPAISAAPPDQSAASGAPSSVSAAEVAAKAREAAAKAGAVIGPAAAKAGAVVVPAAREAAAAVAPVAKEAAAKGWAGSRRGMSFFARVATVGGRAAYSEVVSPQPAARGQVTAPPVAASGPAPAEPAALALLAITLLAAWLVFALAGVARFLAIGGMFIGLLFLSWLGVRRPYFTLLAFEGWIARVTQRGQAPIVPLYRFTMREEGSGQALAVVMVGERKGVDVADGAWVEVWGIREPQRNELRAWKVQMADAAGQPGPVLTAPRLIPLSVALFLPAALILLIALGAML